MSRKKRDFRENCRSYTESSDLKHHGPKTADSICRALGRTSAPFPRFRSDTSSGQTPAHSTWRGGGASPPEPRDPGREENTTAKLRTTAPSLGSNSESLIPRPHLMASRSAWHTLDFATALCSGILAILMSQQLLVHSLSTFTDPVDPWVDLFSGIEVIAFASCVTALSGISKLHPIEHLRPVSTELVLITLAVFLSAYSVSGVFSPLVSMTPVATLLEFVLTSSMLFLSRNLWRRHWNANISRDIARRNILIVGDNPIGHAVKKHLSSMHYMGFRFKGFVTLREDSGDPTGSGDHSIVGKVDDAIELAKSMFVDEIIFSHRPAAPNVLSNVLAQARASGIDIRLIPSLSETLKNRSDLEYFGNLPTIVLHRRDKHAVSSLMKRSADVVLGGLGIIALSPLFAVIAVLIKLQSRGPVLYKSKRVGYKGMAFSCYKFRSMIEDADSARDRLAHLNERCEILFKIAKDPRVTAVGVFLRKYSLDELPQLWNVLTGDMSLVGPRPSIRSEVDQYKTDHLRRLHVVPGMTGLWQVEARQDPSFESYVNLDSKYVRDWSIWLDVKILARTLGVVFRGTGT